MNPAVSHQQGTLCSWKNPGCRFGGCIGSLNFFPNPTRWPACSFKFSVMTLFSPLSRAKSKTQVSLLSPFDGHFFLVMFSLRLLSLRLSLRISDWNSYLAQALSHWELLRCLSARLATGLCVNLSQHFWLLRFKLALLPTYPCML